MTQDLAVQQTTDMAALIDALPAIKAPEIIEEATKAYLPFITIVQGQSNLAGPPHAFPPGSLILRVGKDYENLGKAFDCFICDMRHKAMHFTENGVTSLCDPTTDEFKMFKQNANDKVDGYAWGYEFLLYLGADGRFASFFCNNISMRRSAGNHLAPRIRTAITLMADYVTYKAHSWWSFKAEVCESSFAMNMNLELAIEEIKKFQEERIEEPTADTSELDAR